MAGSHATRAFIWALVLLAAAAGVAAYFSYENELRVARERIAHGSRLAQTACGPIEYAVAGEGPAVLVVHGAGGGFDQAMDFGGALARRGFRVIAPSRFGYLRTPLPADASAAAQADAHACLLDALNVRRVALVGASAGAPSSMLFALRHPDRTRALVLLVPAAYVPRPGNAAPMTTPAGTQFLFDTALRSDALFWAAMRFAPDAMTRGLLATPPQLVREASPEEQARVSRIMQSILPISPRRLGLVNDATVTSTLVRYELERIQAPTLAISLEDDLFGTYDGARYTAAHVPGARFIGYPSGGHIWLGHEQDVIGEIAAFLPR
jgi:pimeloyl-ACP methyl ester carboxylesterase